MVPSTNAKEESYKVTLNDVDVGPVDFVLKCTKGIFEGRFIFCNHTAAGEIFGSDKDNKDLTMYIEDAGLSPQHAQIQYNEQTYQYFLSDLGSSGTWLRCRCVRSIELGIGQVIQVGEEKDAVNLSIEENIEGDPCLEWLKLYNIPQLRDRIPCETMKDVREFVSSGEASSLVVEGEDGPRWAEAIASFERMFPFSEELGEPKSLAVVDERNERIATVWWGGASIYLVDASDKGRESSVVYPGGDARNDIHIFYNSGRYYVHLVPSEKAETTAKVPVGSNPTDELPVVYTRIGTKPHWLQPDDAFRIGALEFAVLRFNAGLSCMQGFRPTMEDAEVCIHDLGASNSRQLSFFAVYDGHGGRECVNFVRENLHRTFVRKLTERGGLDNSKKVRADITEGLRDAFLETDGNFLASCSSSSQHCTAGCAAVVVLSLGGALWCANVGDCRAVLSRGGVAVDLSSDHKPDREDEQKRIEAAGGFISFRRVIGRLAVSRAFGDSEYKCVMQGAENVLLGPLVNCEPEIREDSLQVHDEFVLLACDGVFDVFTSQEAVDFVRTELARMPSQEQNPQTVAELLTHTAIHQRNSKDNVTAIIVTFKRKIEVNSYAAQASPGVIETAD